MRLLRRMLDDLQPLFTKGGRYEKLSALFEIIDTVLYTPGNVTPGAPHARDGIDLKRLMIMVVFAATPVALFAIWNTGYQANPPGCRCQSAGRGRARTTGMSADFRFDPVRAQGRRLGQLSGTLSQPGFGNPRRR